MKRHAMFALFLAGGALSACNCGSDPYAEGEGQSPTGPSHYDAGVPNDSILGNDAGGGQTGNECQEGYTQCLSEKLVAFCLDGKVSGANCAATGLVCVTSDGHSACTEPGVVIPDQDAGQTVNDAGMSACNDTTPKFCTGTVLNWCTVSGFHVEMDCAMFNRICGLDSQGLANCIERPVAGSDAGQTATDAGNSNPNSDAGQNISDAGSQACNQNTPSTCTGSVLNWCSAAGYRYVLDCNLFNQVCGLGTQGTMTCIDRPVVGNDAGQTSMDAGQQSGTDAGTQQCNPNAVPTCTQGILHWCNASGAMSQFNCVQAGLMCGLSEIGVPGCVTVPSAVDAGGNPSILNDGGITNGNDAGSSQSPTDGGVPPIFTDGGTTLLDAGVVGVLDAGVPAGYATSVTCVAVAGLPYSRACTVRGVQNNSSAWQMVPYTATPVRVVIGSVRPDQSEPVCRDLNGVGFECNSIQYSAGRAEFTFMITVGKFAEIGVMSDRTFVPGGVNENRPVYRSNVDTWLELGRTTLSGDVHFGNYQGATMLWVGDPLPIPDGGVTPVTPDAGFVPGSPTYTVSCMPVSGNAYLRACTINGVGNNGTWESNYSGTPVRIVFGSAYADNSEPRCTVVGGIRYGCDSTMYSGAGSNYTFMVKVGKLIRFGVVTNPAYGPGGSKENSETDVADVVTFSDVRHAGLQGATEFGINFTGQYQVKVY